MVHLGLGNFFRAHAALHRAGGGRGYWGYAAFTGRSPAVAETLTGQDALYTLPSAAPRARALRSSRASAPCTRRTTWAPFAATSRTRSWPW